MNNENKWWQNNTKLATRPWWENTSGRNTSATFHKCIWWLVVDRREARYVADQLIKQCRLEQISFLRDERLFSQNNFFCGCRVSRQQSPIDISTVSQVRVVTVL